MAFRNTILAIAIGLGIAVGSTAGATAAPDAPKPSALAGATASLPVVREHYYRMLAKVRPLLFWISRDNVGGARIGWLGDESGSRGLELLIGSDPARAPRRINRWGYIADQVRGTRAFTLGLMKQSDEASIEDAKAGLEHAAGGTHAFKAIRATAANGLSISDVLTLRAGNDLTYRDLGSLLVLVDTSAATTSSRTVNLPAGTRPGFLLALSELIGNPGLKSVPYVYNGRFHRLHVKSAAPASMQVSGRELTKLVRARFETENQATGERTPFEITYGTTGDLSNVPVHLIYQPKWWFQVELFLEDDATKF